MVFIIPIRGYLFESRVAIFLDLLKLLASLAVQILLMETSFMVDQIRLEKLRRFGLLPLIGVHYPKGLVLIMLEFSRQDVLRLYFLNLRVEMDLRLEVGSLNFLRRVRHLRYLSSSSVDLLDRFLLHMVLDRRCKILDRDHRPIFGNGGAPEVFGCL